MSRNCSEVFVAETASRKFIITLEELITSSGTSPVVRERLVDVVGAAAYNSQSRSVYFFRSKTSQRFWFSKSMEEGKASG